MLKIQRHSSSFFKLLVCDTVVVLLQKHTLDFKRSKPVHYFFYFMTIVNIVAFQLIKYMLTAIPAKFTEGKQNPTKADKYSAGRK